MSKEKPSLYIGVGTTSLLALFVILSLLAFAILSYTTAKNDENMAIRTVDSITAYYEGQNKNEEILEEVMSLYLLGDMQKVEALGVKTSPTGEGTVFSWNTAISQKKSIGMEVLIKNDGTFQKNSKVITE